MQDAVAFDFGPFPVLTTERLILRALTPADAGDVFVFWGDPEVQRFNAEPSRDFEETRQFIREMHAAYQAGRSVMWAVAERCDGRVVGAVSLHDWSRRHQRAEVGYTLAQSWWGRGMAYEAVAAVCAFGFDQMGLHRIEAETIADNHRSVRLLERLGFQREGTRREYSLEDDGLFHHSAMYGLLDYEYQRPECL